MKDTSGKEFFPTLFTGLSILSGLVLWVCGTFYAFPISSLVDSDIKKKID